MSEFNSEFRLLLAGALHPLQADEIIRLRDFCSPHIDWLAFSALVERHGLIPTVYRNLSTHTAGLVPQHMLSALKVQAELNRLRVLQFLGVLKRISEWFAQAGIQFCVLKGPPLSQRLFGDVAFRSSTDIDLLIHLPMLAQADALLLANGCERVFPAVALTPRQFQAFQQEWYHYAYLFPGPRIIIELHWSIASPNLISKEAVCQILARARPDASSGNQFATLSSEDLPIYLLVHGSKHSWVRLKWLVDFAVWMRGASRSDWQNLQEQMSDLGLLRSMGQGVLLAHRLFEIQIPKAISSSIIHNPQTQRLAAHSITAMEDPDYRGTEFGRLQRLKIILYAMQLKRGMRYKWDTFRNLWMVPYDWQDVPLPDFLFPLYGLLRPFLWLRRRLQHRSQKAGLPPKV